MTTPDVPLRLDFSIEVTGTPEQVWDAIASAGGLSSWFLRTEMDGRLGGALVMHMGENEEAPATITAWDPPRRLAYEEPEWMSLVGQPLDAPVTPLASEFLVEARSGGTCVVRVVSSAFGTGADWEQEFFDGMAEGWLPFFDNLRAYLAHFAGQRAVTFTVDAKVEGPVDQVRAAVAGRLGADQAGRSVQLDGRTAVVEVAGPAPLLRLTEPVAGLLRFWSFGDDTTSSTQVMGHLFGDGAATAAAAEEQAWTAWLAALDLDADVAASRSS